MKKVKIKLTDRVFRDVNEIHHHTEQIYKEPALNAGVLIVLTCWYWNKGKIRKGKIEWGHAQTPGQKSGD